jgi:amino acid transporter
MEQIRKKVEHLRKKIRNRNILEYLSGVIVITGIIFLYPEVKTQMTRIFFLWVILSVVWIFGYIYFKASNDPLPKGDSDSTLLAYQKHQIEREINVGSHIHWWYLFPLFVGGTGVYFSSEVFGKEELIGFIIFALIFAIMWWINIRAVRKLRQDLKELQK